MSAAKLTAGQVEAARARLLADPELSIRSLAPEFGVNESSLRRALRRSVQHDSLSYDIGFVEVPVITRDYRHLDALYTYPMGDLHVGAPGHLDTRLDEWLGFLEANDDTSMLGIGDLLNAAVVGSKSNVYEEKTHVQESKWILIDKLSPLADAGRIDALNPGNHEARVERLTGEDPVYDIARNLGVPYFKASAFIEYLVGDQRYVVYVRHGTGNGQNVAQMDKSALIAEADVYVTGHVHKQTTTADEYFVLANGVAERRRRYYVTSGAFLAYERYAAERGYKPSRIGAPRIYLSGHKHDVHVSI